MLNAFEPASARFRCPTTPLLEEKINSFSLADIPDIEDPALFHGACIRAALSADDDPRYPFNVDISHRAEKRFYGKKANCNRRRPKVVNSGGCPAIFDGHSAPDMSRRRAPNVSALQIILHQRASLGEYLKYMPVRGFHGIENAIHEFRRYLLVKQVAHGIDEDPSWAFPRERVGQPFRAKREIEPVLEWMSG